MVTLIHEELYQRVPALRRMRITVKGEDKGGHCHAREVSKFVALKFCLLLNADLWRTVHLAHIALNMSSL